MDPKILYYSVSLAIVSQTVALELLNCETVALVRGDTFRETLAARVSNVIVMRCHGIIAGCHGTYGC